MSGWISAINPLSTAKTEAEARRAARASALAIFLGVLWGIWGVYYMMNGGREIMEAAMANASAASPEAASMTGMMATAAIGMAVAFVVIQAVLGLIQWFKPNIVIPIIFAILVVYGLGSGLMSLAVGADMRAQMDIPEPPMWQMVLGWAVLVIELILHIAGIRGAAALGKLKKG